MERAAGEPGQRRLAGPASQTRKAEEPIRAPGLGASAPPVLSRSALLALQRSAGNRAASAYRAGAGAIGAVTARPTEARSVPAHPAPSVQPVVQRKVGFEFETGMLTATYAPGTSRKRLRKGNTDDYQTRDYLDVDNDSPLEGAPLTFNAMQKKEPIVNHRGDPFTAEADEDVDSGKSNLEYVTKPFDDSPQGESEMRATVTKMALMHADLLERATKAKKTVPVKAKELSRYGTPTDGTAILASAGSTNATVQASVGLRLDRVVDLMSQMGGIQPGESQQKQQEMREGRGMLGKGLESPVGVNIDDTNANITGAAPRFAEMVFDEFNRDRGRQFQMTALQRDRAKVLGIVSLAVQYVLTAPSVATYPKVMAPLMARTDFVGLFAQLTDRSQRMLRANNGQLFVDLVLTACGKRGQQYPANQALIPSVYSDSRFDRQRQAGYVSTTMLSGLTRDRWLRGIPAGTDFLTADHFLTAVPNAPNNAEQHIESMGHLHGHTDPVGDEGLPGSVFEIRTAGGKMDYRFWYSHAADVFRYILELNNGQSPVLQNSVLKLSRDDPTLYQKLLAGDKKSLAGALKTLSNDAQQEIDNRMAV